MRTFTTIRQVSGFVKKVLGGKRFHNESETPGNLVVRFELDGQKYRFNASVALLERCESGELIIDESVKELKRRLEAVKR